MEVITDAERFRIETRLRRVPAKRFFAELEAAWMEIEQARKKTLEARKREWARLMASIDWR